MLSSDLSNREDATQAPPRERNPPINTNWFRYVTSIAWSTATGIDGPDCQTSFVGSYICVDAVALVDVANPPATQICPPSTAALTCWTAAKDACRGRHAAAGWVGRAGTFSASTVLVDAVCPGRVEPSMA